MRDFMRFNLRRHVPAFRSAAAGLAALLAAACSPASIVEVETPDVITPGAVATLLGIDPLRNGVTAELASAYSGSGDGVMLTSGLFADEFFLSDSFQGRIELDTRLVLETNDRLGPLYRTIHRARRSSEYTAAQIRRLVANPAADFRYSEMLSYAGLSYFMLGENFCSPQPMAVTQDDGTSLTPIPNISQVEINTIALSKFDSALTAASGLAVGAVRTRLENLARMGRGRALLNLGQFAAAATAVTAVPTTYLEVSTHSLVNSNGIWSLNASGRRYTISDREAASPAELALSTIPDGVGLNFRSANDPRIPYIRPRVSATSPAFVTAFDPAAPLFIMGRFATQTGSTPWIYGVEARLIEAEAALRSGSEAGYINALNALRATVAAYPAIPANDPISGAFTPTSASVPLPALVAPTPGVVDREDAKLLFRERAFWLYASGRRFGDLRRSLRQYNAAPFNFTEANIFPGGGSRVFFSDAGGGGTITRSARLGASSTYGTQVAWEIPQPEDNNPDFDRGACSITTP